MKKIIYVLLLLLSSSSLTWAKAIQLTFPNSLVIPLKVLQRTTPALPNGIIKSQYIMTRTQPLVTTTQTSICVEKGDYMDETAFSGNSINPLNKSFKQRLADDAYPIVPVVVANCKGILSSTDTYNNIKTCANNPQYCNSSISTASREVLELVTQSQFVAGLAEISPGKTLIEDRLNDGISFTTPEEIGFPSNTKHCSEIIAYGDITTGEATIQCTLTGSIFIEGKMVFLTRTSEGIWNCSSNLTGTDKEKFAGLCNG